VPLFGVRWFWAGEGSDAVVTPYYQDDLVTIYHGDARELLPSLDGAFDCLLTDPPYSSGGFQESGKSAGSIGTRTDAVLQFDNLSTRGYERLMREVLRWANQADEAFVFTDWRMWVYTFDALEAAGWRVRNMLVWDKMQMGMGMPWRNQHELVAFGKRSPGRIIEGKTGNVLRVRRSRNDHHPTEKPLDLLRTLLLNSEATVIADPFAGSGTTLVAAKDLGRRAIGIEIEERYCEIAARRCSQEVLGLSA
jgi:DNA modification methylase